MDSNTHSVTWLDRLAALEAEVDRLAPQGLDGLTDVALTEGVLRRLANRVDAHWLAWLAAVDARGAAGPDQDGPAGSTAAWLRTRLHLGAGAAASLVRTARALFRGPLTGTARPWPTGSCRWPMLRCWPTAPTTWLIRSPPRPNPSYWTRPGGWTHPGCAGPWPICAG
jgi:hypothetical protein